ncbi:tRNA (guanosine(37)-N1)-methyltransferase TrmD [Alicyclobacillus sp. SO9]|uniref:tRNA (guanosine(37)-N1)-methyltransferase TrmD n=1 Tax=Alicyclobacillus sp. SO9 TaxID=2665646 RepID=UPI0018E8B226|nr:tRNA (guanosine(37)-N1)-methyltransferase TrmD [Alicyclobacillus sp. SO9]QQE81239.1 tRNA (guanosine(37)-N1)-methyltransferase TrmD [Alicyclobacillus sp. SO9]
MRIRVLTLFPEMFTGVLNESIIKRARDEELVDIEVVNFRDYATDKHRTVDDYPFGGGAGMLLKPAPIFDAVDSVIASLDNHVTSLHQDAARMDVDTRINGDTESAKGREIVLMTPQGAQFTQKMAQELSQLDDLVLICGHYEGFDERIRSFVATKELSVGDFVLTGGEIPAMAVMDAVVRLLPGALGNEASAEEDSFASGLLEHPQYTRPADYRGHTVPAVLLSGNHAKVAQWRHEQSLYRTWIRRPDLLETVALSAEDRRLIDKWERNVSDGKGEGVE